MNKLLKSVRSVGSGKDDLVKKAIVTQLSNSVKEIQYAGVEDKETKVDNSEAANQLCNTIEALFLHGLKNSLSHRFKRAIADVDERPEPSFWPPLLVISHRQIIDQITNLSHITTEVGQCRAWIRLALNDCLLSSYLMTMKQDSSSLKSFYSTGAFVRDSELLDVAQRLLEGVEAFKSFALPCNSSLLNSWPLPSLYLAGIWAPTLKACPVAPCDDVAQSIEEATLPKTIPNTSETCSLSSAISINSQNSSLRQIVSLSEDEVLKIILAKDKASTSSLDTKAESPEAASSSEELANCNLGNSLGKRTGWSFDENQDEAEPLPKPEPKSMEASFNALVESYNMFSGDFIRTPDIKTVWQQFEEKRDEQVSFENKQVETSPILSKKAESSSLAAQITKLAREKGLDAQNYECAACKAPLSITQKPFVCAFTGEYFCASCMSEEEIPIPANIIHNWDFKPCPVSQKSFNYINEIKDHPTIDFKVLNPYIYSVVEEMAQLQNLRTQLNFLRAYLYTCREPIIEQLQKQMWPREYMYEHVHQYSITDLNEVQNGVLAQQLQKVVAFGKEHVSACWLCSQKGFVCEICSNPKALFPFDIEIVFRCEECNAVFHKGCLTSNRPCPKCERRKKREDLPLLGAIAVETIE